jgi:hypothetical protein
VLSRVGYDLRASGTDLPLPEVRRAAQEVDLASRRLAVTLVHAPVAALRAALEHLDAAAGALVRAQHTLQGYLASTGARPAPAPSTVDEPVRADWWVARIAHLTGYRPAVNRPRAASSAELLDAALARARAGDRTGLAEVLAAAGPSTGLGLTALTAPLIAARLAEPAGDPRPAVRNLLPGLPEGVVDALLAGGARRPWEHHPTDPAVAGTVLLAALLNS